MRTRSTTAPASAATALGLALGAVAAAVAFAPSVTAEGAGARTFGESWADLVVVAPDRLPGGSKGYMVGHPDIEEVLVAEVRETGTGGREGRVLAADPDELAGFQRVFGQERETGAWGDLREGALVPASGSEDKFPSEHARVRPFGAFPVAEAARPPVPGVDAVAPVDPTDEARPGRTNAALISARWADQEELSRDLLAHLPRGSTVTPVKEWPEEDTEHRAE
ncbi:hypothetical protein [Nocardiopsis baichengensis]|uniref:hypothetical protein n=1 Tax=Nocardiopsis baichengensis TaxID=280240 RepID=UPI000344FF8C|nr:hypothetical protein [Nocardiopsis baichengensis]